MFNFAFPALKITKLPKWTGLRLLLLAVGDLLQAELHVGVLVVNLYDGVPHQLDEHLRPKLLQGFAFHVDLCGFFYKVFYIHLAEFLFFLYLLLKKQKLQQVITILSRETGNEPF